LAEVSRYGSYNALMDLFDGKVAIDYDHTHMVAGGDLAVLGVDAGEEVGLLLLEAIFVVAGGFDVAGVAAAGTGQGGVQIREEKDGQIGLEVVAEQAVKIEDDVGAELASAALVGLGGVSEAVAEDNLGRLEGGGDDLLDGLGAVSEHHGEFGMGGQAGGAGVKKESANVVADGGSAGLAGDDMGPVAAGEPLREALDLGGFAGPVEAFKGDEEAFFFVRRHFRLHAWSLPFGEEGERGRRRDDEVPKPAGGFFRLTR